MSSQTTRVHLQLDSRNVEVTISARPRATGSAHHEEPGEEGSWEVVDGFGVDQDELAVATEDPPLHLLRRARLAKAEDWTPEARIRRAFEFGQADTQSALDSIPQRAADRFPLRSTVYVILYDPSGQWPRYTRSLQRFYEVTKIPCRGVAPTRNTPWRAGIVSRGFPSIVEAEAYLAGGRCRLPREEF